MSRIKNLEEKFEVEERSKRRNNIMVKGLTVKDENAREEVSAFLKEKLKLAATIKHSLQN